MRERYRIRSQDPDQIAYESRRLRNLRAVERRCDEEGFLITREFLIFQAEQTLAWGDRDYEDPEQPSFEAHRERIAALLEHRALTNRKVWVERNNRDPMGSFGQALLKSYTAQEKFFVRKILRAAGITPSFRGLLQHAIYLNVDGSVEETETEAHSPAQARRAFIRHNWPDWNGKAPEPEAAADIRAHQVQTINELGVETVVWVVGPVGNPKARTSSYVDCFPALGEDGKYRWGGSPLVFAPDQPLVDQEHRLSISELETAFVQGARIADEFDEVNELVGGPQVRLDLDDGLQWEAPDQFIPADPRERGVGRDTWHPSWMSHEEQFFHDLLLQIGEFDAAARLLERGPGPHRYESYMARQPNTAGKVVNTLMFRDIGEEPDHGTPWTNDPDLRSRLLQAMKASGYSLMRGYIGP